MNIHVFVVDSTTFKYHLEYMFAGTGAKDKASQFLTDTEAYCHHSTERNLVGMIADISRIRPEDKIVFYLQATSDNPGMFFGTFKAKSLGFFDENNDDNYLVNQLEKGLSFRVLISPDQVYPYGITEHEFLDDLTGKKAPYQLCWSLIYRKLKGNRGCTMITKYEYEDLLSKLDAKNNHQLLSNTAFSFDTKECKIININNKNQYNGRMDSLNIEPRLLYKAHKKKSFETHLQALVMQKFDNPILSDKLLSLNNGSTWIGNEVSCGVGMQRIDTIIIEESPQKIYIKIIELKDEEPYDYIIDEQLPWYLKWSSQYIIPNLQSYGKQIIIQPCILAKKTEDQKIINKIQNTSLISMSIDNVSLYNTQYIAFDIDDNTITFDKII